MKSHPLYKKLKQKALDGNYTIEQVRSLGFNSAAELLGTRSFSAAFLKNMKRQLVVELWDLEDELNREFIASQAALKARWPHLDVERGREGSKPYVTIWLQGKPWIVREDSQGE